jgi:FAD-dependent oxidoreductase domain-containing protein 1
MLSAGGIRQQFSGKENIEMSMYSAEFLLNATETLTVDPEDPPDIQFHQNGYLMLSNTPRGDAILGNNNRSQHAAGADWLHLGDKQKLKELYPWLNNEDLTLGSYSTKNEGYFDPWAYVNALKAKAKTMGVDFIEAEVVGGTVEVDESSGGMVLKSLSTKDDEDDIKSATFINAAGAWSNGLVSKINAAAPKQLTSLPVEARKRCIFMFHCPDLEKGPPSSTPLTVFPDGVYFRPEGKGGRFITGLSPHADMDPHCDDDRALDFVDHVMFESEMWPSLATYVPAFENIKVMSSWAGFYEYNTLDQNCIMGAHPDVNNFLICAGFSGHGLQMSPAAGMAMAELVTDGKFVSMDLANFSYNRILSSEAYMEDAVI